MARSRRRGDLGASALGRQRHDRALGRHPARAHDARRCRAGARRRRSGAEPARPRELLEADHAPDPGRRARAARRDRSRDGRPHGSRRDGAGVRRRRRGPPGTRTARAARRRRGEPGARQGDARGRHRTSSRRRASATTERARSRSRRRRASPSTRDDTRTPVRHWPAPTDCGRCSTTAFPGRRSKSGSSSHAPISRSPTPARPARYSPRPSRCSSCVPTWAHSSRRRASCTSAWRRPTGRPAPGR